MIKLSEYIGKQCGKPHGLIGRVFCIMMNVANNIMYNNIVSLIPKDSVPNVLDVGCGNGYLIKKLSRKTKSHLYGVDISEDMIHSTAIRNKKALAEKRLELSVGNCCNLPFKDKTFNIVTTINTIYFWDDTLKGLSEIKRVLKDNGVFYNAVYSKQFLGKLSYTRKGFKFFKKSDYIKLGRKAGFSSVEIKEIVSGKSYIIKYIK